MVAPRPGGIYMVHRPYPSFPGSAAISPPRQVNSLYSLLYRTVFGCASQTKPALVLSLLPFYQQSSDEVYWTSWVSPRSLRQKLALWPRARPTLRLLKPKLLISRGSTGGRILDCASSTSMPSSSVSLLRPRVTMGKHIPLAFPSAIH